MTDTKRRLSAMKDGQRAADKAGHPMSIFVTLAYDYEYRRYEDGDEKRTDFVDIMIPVPSAA